MRNLLSGISELLFEAAIALEKHFADKKVKQEMPAKKKKPMAKVDPDVETVGVFYSPKDLVFLDLWKCGKTYCPLANAIDVVNWIDSGHHSYIVDVRKLNN